MVQDVWQGFVRVTTSSAPLVAVPESLRPVQEHTVQPRAMDKPPVGKAGEVAGAHEVVWRHCDGCHVENFALVRFRQQSPLVIIPDRAAEGLFGVSCLERMFVHVILIHELCWYAALE